MSSFRRRPSALMCLSESSSSPSQWGRSLSLLSLAAIETPSTWQSSLQPGASPAAALSPHSWRSSFRCQHSCSFVEFEIFAKFVDSVRASIANFPLNHPGRMLNCLFETQRHRCKEQCLLPHQCALSLPALLFVSVCLLLDISASGVPFAAHSASRLDLRVAAGSGWRSLPEFAEGVCQRGSPPAHQRHQISGGAPKRTAPQLVWANRGNSGRDRHAPASHLTCAQPKLASCARVMPPCLIHQRLFLKGHDQGRLLAETAKAIITCLLHRRVK